MIMLQRQQEGLHLLAELFALPAEEVLETVSMEVMANQGAAAVTPEMVETEARMVAAEAAAIMGAKEEMAARMAVAAGAWIRLAQEVRMEEMVEQIQRKLKTELCSQTLCHGYSRLSYRQKI